MTFDPTLPGFIARLQAKKKSYRSWNSSTKKRWKGLRREKMTAKKERVKNRKWHFQQQ